MENILYGLNIMKHGITDTNRCSAMIICDDYIFVFEQGEVYCKLSSELLFQELYFRGSVRLIEIVYKSLFNVYS